jgi:hypothetical protein
MVVRSGFTHTKIMLEERGPVNGCEVWFYPHKNPIREERGPVDGYEVWFYPHKNPVRGERTSGWL